MRKALIGIVFLSLGLLGSSVMASAAGYQVAGRASIPCADGVVTVSPTDIYGVTNNFQDVRLTFQDAADPAPAVNFLPGIVVDSITNDQAAPTSVTVTSAGPGTDATTQDSAGAGNRDYEPAGTVASVTVQVRASVAANTNARIYDLKVTCSGDPNRVSLNTPQGVGQTLDLLVTVHHDGSGLSVSAGDGGSSGGGGSNASGGGEGPGGSSTGGGSNNGSGDSGDGSGCGNSGGKGSDEGQDNGKGHSKQDCGNGDDTPANAL
ncbi:MAG: hypothetical protein ACYDGR_08215 [Candidatus Dormibacteria bacterium]